MSRHMFLALVGPDGVGKTTLAASLQSIAEDIGVPFGYVHWRPHLWERPANEVHRESGPAPTKAAVPQEITPSMRFVSVLRLARSVLAFNAYFALRIWPELRKGGLVVADRWIYNYVGQPTSVRYYGPGFLARIACQYLTVRPGLVFALELDPNVIRQRKDELSVAEIREEVATWRRFGPEIGARYLDASEKPETLAEAVGRIALRS